MTYETFQTLVKNKTRFERYLYYTLSSAVIVISVFIFYGLSTSQDRFYGGDVFMYGIALFFFSLGASGFYLLPNRYKVRTVDVKSTVVEKHRILNKIMQEFDVANLKEELNWASFTISSGFWNTNYRVLMFFDEARFAFCVQVYGGFIDFGGSEKRRHEIADAIKQ